MIVLQQSNSGKLLAQYYYAFYSSHSGSADLPNIMPEFEPSTLIWDTGISSGNLTTATHACPSTAVFKNIPYCFFLSDHYFLHLAALHFCTFSCNTHVSFSLHHLKKKKKPAISCTIANDVNFCYLKGSIWSSFVFPSINNK